MVDGIRKGYFDEGSIIREAKKAGEVRTKAEGEAGLSAAWRRYHDSFDQDEEAVANELLEGSLKHIKYLSALNLNGAYTILDGIGYPDKAEKLLEAFIKEFSDTPSVFDLSASPFGGEVDSLPIREAFEAQSKTHRPPLPSPSEAAKAIYKGAWSPKDDQAWRNCLPPSSRLCSESSAERN
jgi:hypothetical protein